MTKRKRALLVDPPIYEETPSDESKVEETETDVVTEPEAAEPASPVSEDEPAEPEAEPTVAEPVAEPAEPEAVAPIASGETNRAKLLTMGQKRN